MPTLENPLGNQILFNSVPFWVQKIDIYMFVCMNVYIYINHASAVWGTASKLTEVDIFCLTACCTLSHPKSLFIPDFNLVIFSYPLILSERPLSRSFQHVPNLFNSLSYVLILNFTLVEPKKNVRHQHCVRDRLGNRTDGRVSVLRPSFSVIKW